MKRIHGRLCKLFLFLIVLYLLVAPMRVVRLGKVQSSKITMNLTDSYPIVTPERAGLYTFESVNPEIVSIDAQGVVTAHRPGTTKLRVFMKEGLAAIVNVEVTGRQAQSIGLNESSLTLIKGDITALVSTIFVGDENADILWSSSAPHIVEVDSEGRITAENVGSATITASSLNGATATCHVTVLLPAESMSIDEQGLRVGPGASVTLHTSFEPSDASDTRVQWQTTDECITLDEDGTVRAMRAGTATVRAVSESGLFAETTVTVDESVAVLNMVEEELSLERGMSYALNWSCGPAQHYILWSSSDPEVATVDNGIITALKSGETDVTVVCDGQEKTCHVEVGVYAHTITLNYTESYLLKDQTSNGFQLAATLDPSDVDDPTIVYTTDNPVVAYADRNGKVTVTGAYGTAVITATTVGGAQAAFTVHVVTELPEEQDNVEH